jgi:hypothetical protein
MLPSAVTLADALPAAAWALPLCDDRVNLGYAKGCCQSLICRIQRHCDKSGAISLKLVWRQDILHLQALQAYSLAMCDLVYLVSLLNFDMQAGSQ